MRITTMTTMAMAVAAMVAGIPVDARAEVLQKTTFKGNSAFAFFNEDTPITCADGSAGTLTTSVGVNGNEFVSHDRQLPDQASNTVSVFASRFDSCTGTGFFGQGSLDNALRQNGLQSATMIGTVPLTDSDGNPVGTVTVNLALNGTGGTSSSQSHNRFEFESPDGLITFTSHFKGTSRNATVTGSVVFNGVEMIGNLSFADLTQSKDGSSQLLK